MKRDEGLDPKELLRSYWASQKESMAPPADLVEQALLRAARDVPLNVEGRFARPVRKALVGVAGMAIVAVLGILFLPSMTKAPVNSWRGLVPLHQAAEGGAAVPAQAVASHEPVLQLALSRAGNLWKLTYAKGRYVLSRNTAHGAWTEAVSARGRGAPTARLSFFTPQDGALMIPQPQAGWALWETQNGGATWTPVTLPSAAALYPQAVFAEFPGVEPWLALTGSQRRTVLYRETGPGRWRLLKSAGLPTGIDGLRFASSQAGAASAGSVVYETQDGGSTWELRSVRNESMAPAKSVQSGPSMTLAVLDGVASQVGSQEWVVSREALWTRLGSAGPWDRVGRLPFSGAARNLVFVTKRIGYVLSHTGSVWVTENGGKSWRLDPGA